MPMDRAKYPKDWTAISNRVRQRAGQRCERCKAPNGASVARADGCYMLTDGSVFSDVDGAPMGKARGSEFPAKKHLRIVLTVAHLDHDSMGTDETRMQALCQKCHLAYDRDQHTASAKATRRGRKAVGNLPGIE